MKRGDFKRNGSTGERKGKKVKEPDENKEQKIESS